MINKDKIRLSVIASLTLLALYGGVQTVLAQEPGGKFGKAVSIADTFTYQGYLTDGSSPANGVYDLRVSVYNAETDGSLLGSAQLFEDLTITGGVFTLNLSPAALNTIFTGDARWLQVEVRPGASTGAFTVLPRQPITGAPYAWGLRGGAVVNSAPTAYDGWVFKASVNGYYPNASAINAYAPTGDAVRVSSDTGNGISASTKDGFAVYGYDGGTQQARGYGGYFKSVNGIGVYGESDATVIQNENRVAAGVFGQSKFGAGVFGFGESTMAGVAGESEYGDGVYGATHSGDADKAGVSGYSSHGAGVQGQTWSGAGIRGEDLTSGLNSIGVLGRSISSLGHGGHFINVNTIPGSSQVGLWAGSYYNDVIQGHDLNSDGSSANLVFRVTRTGVVYADGSYNCGWSSSCFNANAGADVAERIDTRGALAPGDVVEIDPEHPAEFRLSRTAFSTLVAGVVSTNPAMTMNNSDLTNNDAGERTDARPLLALVGQVPVKVSAENGAIMPGDLLVASSTPGHAMRAGEHPMPGTVIGKALEELEQGTGVIKMLVALQ